MPRVLLLVDGDKNVLRDLHHLLRQDGYDIMTADSGGECLRLLTEQEAQVVAAGPNLPDMGGEELLARVRERHPEAVQMLLAEQADAQNDAAGGAAFRHLPQSWTDDLMRSRIRDAFRFRELIRKNSQLSRFLSDPIFDRLTNLPNRLLFIDRLNMALVQAKRDGDMVGVILLDLDRFKIINDTLGHRMGDEVLREVARRLNAHTRQEDSVARLGGDEFALLMHRLSRIEDAVTFNRKLLDVFKTPFVIDDRELTVSPSLGVSVYPDNGSRAETLIRNADTAMGWSKEQGGNCYCFYTPTMHATAFRRLTLVNNLHRALEKNQFVLYFQPQMNLATGRITGAEALVRWQNPESGLLLPSQFIPVAEESGLIVPIGAWALHSACLQGRHWYEQGHTNLRVAVNLSARLFAQENLLTMIEEVLAETNMPPCCLGLEITESILMQNAVSTTAILDRLKAKGIQISMDDFGTGYSSLSYLKRFPIDALKVDRSFVKDVATNPDDAAIVTAIVAMAHSLKLRVVAEGVETEEQAAFLRELGCHDIQGYLISKPVPATEFERMIAAQKDRGQLEIPMN